MCLLQAQLLAGGVSGWCCLATNAVLPVRPVDAEGYLLHHMEQNAPFLVAWYMGLCSLLAAVCMNRDCDLETALLELFHNGDKLPIQVLC